jgi:hypothetical protein
MNLFESLPEVPEWHVLCGLKHVGIAWRPSERRPEGPGYWPHFIAC